MPVLIVTPARLWGAVEMSPTPTHVEAVPQDTFHTCWRPPGIGADAHEAPPFLVRSATTFVLVAPIATHDAAEVHVIAHSGSSAIGLARHDAPPLTVFSITLFAVPVLPIA